MNAYVRGFGVIDVIVLDARIGSGRDAINTITVDH